MSKEYNNMLSNEERIALGLDTVEKLSEETQSQFNFLHLVQDKNGMLDPENQERYVKGLKKGQFYYKAHGEEHIRDTVQASYVSDNKFYELQNPADEQLALLPKFIPVTFFGEPTYSKDKGCYVYKVKDSNGFDKEIPVTPAHFFNLILKHEDLNSSEECTYIPLTIKVKRASYLNFQKFKETLKDRVTHKASTLFNKLEEIQKELDSKNLSKEEKQKEFLDRKQKLINDNIALTNPVLQFLTLSSQKTTFDNNAKSFQVVFTHVEEPVLDKKSQDLILELSNNFKTFLEIKDRNTHIRTVEFIKDKEENLKYILPAHNSIGVIEN